MRLRSFILFSFIPIFFFTAALQSQDTNIVKYLPLKVGNVWVYNYNWGGSHQVKLKVTGSVIENGHIYYIIEQTGNPCPCTFSSYSPFLVSLNNPIRIDSMTGNIFFRGTSCGWHTGESLLDSLKMPPGTYRNTSCFFVGCGDTNNYTIFGNSYPSMLMGTWIIPNYYTVRRYAKGIGLVRSNMGCAFSTYCQYDLSGCVLNGIVYGDTGFVVGVNKLSSEVPESFALLQNYPNPFNPATRIKFSLPAPSKGGVQEIKLMVYNILGKEVASLIPPLWGGKEGLSPGTYEVEWDGTNYPSGVYYYTLTAGEFKETKRMVLIK